MKNIAKILFGIYCAILSLLFYFGGATLLGYVLLFASAVFALWGLVACCKQEKKTE